MWIDELERCEKIVPKDRRNKEFFWQQEDFLICQGSGHQDESTGSWEKWQRKIQIENVEDLWNLASFFIFLNVKIIKSYCYWDEMTLLPLSMKKKMNKKRNKYCDEQLWT